MLQPNQSQTISFVVNASDISSFDTKSASWIAEGGKYDLKIGASSSDIKQSASFTVAKDVVVEKITNQLAPKAQINELKK